MRNMVIVLCLLGLLAGGVSGCAVLTDTVNRRADAEASEADLQLRQDVLNRLQQDVMTRSHSVGVDTQNGVVTLYGSVPDDLTRHRILAVVRGTPGVMGINDRLVR